MQQTTATDLAALGVSPHAGLKGNKMNIIDCTVSCIAHTYELINIDLNKNTATIKEPRLNSSNNGNSMGYGGHNIVELNGKAVKYLKDMFEQSSLYVNLEDDVITIDDVMTMCAIRYVGRAK